MIWSLAFLVVGYLGTAGLATAGLLALEAVQPSAATSTAAAAVVQAAAGVAVFGALTAVVGRRILRLSREELGWWPLRPGIRGFGRGLALGLGIGGLALGAGVLLGAARWAGDGGSALAYGGRLGLLALLLLPPAFMEEFAFRGVALAGITRARGPGAGIMVTALVFGASHGFNPGVTVLALGNTVLAGLLLGLTFLLRGGLWTATGTHLGWNLALAGLAAPVSGLPFEIPGIDYLAGGPTWLTGGEFGPEGGLLGTSALAVGIVVAARWRATMEDS